MSDGLNVAPKILGTEGFCESTPFILAFDANDGLYNYDIFIVIVSSNL